MAYTPKALVACCDCENRRVLVNLVTRCGLEPVIATGTRDAVSMLSSESVCVGFCQDDLPGEGFKAVLKAAQAVGVPVAVTSRLAEPGCYLESMQLGAFDFICLPYYYAEVAALAIAMLHKTPQPATSSGANVRVA